MVTAADAPPRSATPFAVGLLGIAAGLAALWLTSAHTTLDGPSRGGAACLAIVAVIAAHQLLIARVYLRPSAGLAPQTLRALSVPRVAVRLAALGSIYAAIALLYWLLPEYHGSFYQPYWAYVRAIAPYIAIGAPLYFAWMDRRLQNPDDAYLQWGRYLLRREAPASWQPVRELLAGWGVKAFFLPLMTVYLSTNADHMSQSLANALAAPYTLATYRFMYDLAFTMDLLFATVGYLCTFRILDTQVRSAEPTVLGWLVAIVCYQPFWSLISNQYLNYQGSMYWDNWLGGVPVLRFAWGAAIVALLLCYAMCTVSFGLRFSNLTNRGIITSGPYRFTKHPAYLCKNLAYWMISVPFIEPLGWQIGIMHTGALLGVNLLYYMRAKTEERHLMRDPEYREYAAWISRHGLFAAFTRRAD